MAYQPVPDVAQIVIEGRMDNQLVLNDLYFAVSGGGITPINLLTITDAVATWWQGVIMPNLSEDYTSVRAVGIDLTTQTGARVEVAAASAGGVGSEAAPNNVAACVSFRTALRGRSFRGRNYVAGIPNADITLNTLGPSFISSLVDGYTQLVGAGLFEAGWEWVVVSRQTLGDPRPEGIPSPVATVAMTTNTVRSMRSREVGHGA